MSMTVRFMNGGPPTWQADEVNDRITPLVNGCLVKPGLNRSSITEYEWRNPNIIIIIEQSTM